MKSINIYGALLAAPLMFAACSSDSNDVPAPVEEFEGIVLNIPNPNLSTRAIEDDEKAINSLVVLAYPSGNPSSTPQVFDLEDITSLSTNAYTQVPVRLKNGTYHIYVLANLSSDKLSSNTAWESLTESALQGATLSLNPANISSGNLPMTCNYKAIRQTPTQGNTPGTVFTNGEVTITPKSTTHVYADLTYAVAKVRYTMLNGKTPGLSMNEEAPIKVLNYATVESAMTYKEDLNVSSQLADATITNGNYYACPEYTGVPEDSAVDNLDGDKGETSWAYQGIVYVPERLFQATDTDDNKTKLHFIFNDNAYNEKSAFAFGGNTTVTGAQTGEASIVKNGIIRGTYYDIMAYTESKTVSIQVRVKPWGYFKNVQDLNEFED